MAGASRGRERAWGWEQRKGQRRASPAAALQAQAWALFSEVGPSSSRICLFLINQHWRQEGLDVKTMMNTWTLQKGFPLITITVRGRNVHMKQEYYVKGAADAPETG